MRLNLETIFCTVLVLKTTDAISNTVKKKRYEPLNERRNIVSDSRLGRFEDADEVRRPDMPEVPPAESDVPRKFAPVTNLMIVNISNSELPHVTLPSKIIKWKSLASDRKIKNKTSTTTTSTTTRKPPARMSDDDIMDINVSPVTWKAVDFFIDNIENLQSQTKTAKQSVKATNNSVSRNKSAKRPGSHSKEEVCDHYKKQTIKFDLSKMADVWQTAYYKLPEKVQCFRIQIKKLTKKEKDNYAALYGNFSDLVNWDECNLEIKPASPSGRKHFLQGNNEDEGVLDNIIIESAGEFNRARVREESADQWLVVHNMLLMRDCDTGGVVAFTKVPAAVKHTDLEFAFKDFSEDYRYGKMACEDEPNSNSFDPDDENSENFR